jgi:hypothetical protein
MKKIIIWLMAVLMVIILSLLFGGRGLSTRILGESRYRTVRIQPGNILVPHERAIEWKKSSGFTDSIIESFAKRTVTNDMLRGKGNGPRIILAKLLDHKDTAEANKILIKITPWGVTGSSWALNRKGDYDFSLMIFTTILWKFGDSSSILYPATRDHLLNVVLTADGNRFRYTAPHTLGLVRETENHLLMTEGSRYLKNRWMMIHGNNDPRFNNEKNGMEDKILAVLSEMKSAGLYEFNSIPYIGYTITALLNLEAFASEKVSDEARNVLDYMNFCYAIGSYKLKHYPPMRRRYEKEPLRGLVTDYQTVFMKSWLSFSPVTDYDRDISNAETHALMGCCMPYRPPDRVIQLLFDKEDGYFIKLGHGTDASPEIYSAGRHFLLSAGGVNRGKRSLIVARPITLFLDDNAVKLSETFHLSGPGTDFMKWNNTGVCRNFAVAAGRVSIPDMTKPFTKEGNWSLFLGNDAVSLVIYSTEKLGLMAFFEGKRPAGLLEDVIKSNRDEQKLFNSFRFPDGREISYDTNAPKDEWVIIADDKKTLDRDFDRWPLIEGNFNR